jgi:hypothetical protein
MTSKVTQSMHSAGSKIVLREPGFELARTTFSMNGMQNAHEREIDRRR